MNCPPVNYPPRTVLDFGLIHSGSCNVQVWAGSWHKGRPSNGSDQLFLNVADSQRCHHVSRNVPQVSPRKCVKAKPRPQTKAPVEQKPHLPCNATQIGRRRRQGAAIEARGCRRSGNTVTISHIKMLQRDAQQSLFCERPEF